MCWITLNRLQATKFSSHRQNKERFSHTVRATAISSCLFRVCPRVSVFSDRLSRFWTNRLFPAGPRRSSLNQHTCSTAARLCKLRCSAFPVLFVRLKRPAPNQYCCRHAQFWRLLDRNELPSSKNRSSHREFHIYIELPISYRPCQLHTWSHGLQH